MSLRIWAAGLLTAACVWTAVPAGAAELKVSALFADGMVLQRDARVPIWGTADDGATVTVTLGAQTVSATAAKGKWTAYLEPVPAGGPFEITVVSAGTTIRLRDVLAGDVWLCAGESNMEWSMLGAYNGLPAIAASRNPRLRLFQVGKMIAPVPRHELQGRWQPVTPETLGDFSAVAYFFGRELQKSIDVPIGLIQVTWSATPAESWTSRDGLQRDPRLTYMLDAQAKALDEYVQSVDALIVELQKYRDDTVRSIAVGTDAPALPSFSPFLSPAFRAGSPANVYNGMIAPIAPLGIRGVVLYQGEANVARYKEYPAVLPALIADWRRAWQREALPFLIVQLAPYGRVDAEPQDSRWAEIREVQRTVAAATPGTYLVVTTDAGTPGTMNPIDKEPVGARLALAARALEYRQSVVASGPAYESMRIEGGKAILQFEHCGSGLVAKDNHLAGFAIAGEDGKFVRARAQIQGDTVIVWSPAVTKPVSVRYGWGDFPDGTLMNREGLPASPFQVQ